jgi:hypothetical protein
MCTYKQFKPTRNKKRTKEFFIYKRKIREPKAEKQVKGSNRDAHRKQNNGMTAE